MIAPQPSPTTAASRVLVADDEPQLVRELKIVLRGAGYVVESAPTTPEALAVVAGRAPDALLLDLELPDGEAIEVCDGAGRFGRVPILLMSATGAEREKRNALDAGADDYLPKRFRGAGLLGRVHGLLGESAGVVGASRLEIGEVIVDLVRRRVTRAGAVLLLEATELELVRVLAQRRGMIITDGGLLRAVWGDKRGRETHRLRVAIARLRVKLERDRSRAEYLVPEPGIGYRLTSPGEALP
jgi:two-component system, OmpR family, KDP operon response regulator KdpE